MKKIMLLISIMSACIVYNCESFASTPNNKHKEHEIKSGTPLPVYFVTTQNSLTIYFEAAIGEINLTITDKNNKVIYMRQFYIGEPMSLPIELDTPTEKYTVYINEL